MNIKINSPSKPKGLFWLSFSLFFTGTTLLAIVLLCYRPITPVIHKAQLLSYKDQHGRKQFQIRSDGMISSQDVVRFVFVDSINRERVCIVKIGKTVFSEEGDSALFEVSSLAPELNTERSNIEGKVVQLAKAKYNLVYSLIH